MYVYLHKLKLKISIFLPVCMFILVWLEGVEGYLILMSAAVIHEMGHLFAIKLCGAEIMCIEVRVIGAVIFYNSRTTSYRDDMYISLAGPALNLAFAFAGCLLFIVFYNVRLLLFIATNFFLAFVNMLPISGLDGGSAFEAVMCMGHDLGGAVEKCKTASILAKLVLLIFTGFLVVISGFNTAMIVLFILNIIQLLN